LALNFWVNFRLDFFMVTVFLAF